MALHNDNERSTYQSKLFPNTRAMAETERKVDKRTGSARKQKHNIKILYSVGQDNHFSLFVLWVESGGIKTIRIVKVLG